MARVSTYRLRHKKSNREAVVNQSDYHADLGRWTDWERVGQTHAPNEGAVVETASEEPVSEDEDEGPLSSDNPESSPAKPRSKKK